eukprot:6148979-Karenia_brevis.AAC.1
MDVVRSIISFASTGKLEAMVAVRRQGLMIQLPPPPFRTVLQPLAVPPNGSLRVLRSYADD